MDTKFSSAIHALILISESETPMNSEQIATSVGTNASYIRKLTTRLRIAEIIEGHRGISGFRLIRKPEDISLLEIYKSVMEIDSLHLFDIHQNPNDGRFAKRSGMSLPKRILCQMAGRKYDKMAAKKDQTYDFLFVHEDGRQLEYIGKVFDKDHPLETSVDEIFRLDQINEAMAKVKHGKSKGKTIIIMEK